jgi:hypothetical protein
MVWIATSAQNPGLLVMTSSRVITPTRNAQLPTGIGEAPGPGAQV